MIRINHIAIAAQLSAESAANLRSETGLGFYDGGYVPGGGGSHIVPVGPGVYIQISTHFSGAPGTAKVPDRFQGLNLRVDTREELEKIAAAKGMTTIDHSHSGRIQANGEHVAVVGMTGGKIPPGMPPIYWFDMATHPSGHPVEPAYGLVRPVGIAWVEVGGTEAEMSAWIGSPASVMPLRYNGKAAGVYSLGIKLEGGKEITIQRASSSEA